MTPDDRKRAIGKVVSVAADKFTVEMHRGTDNFTVVGFDDVHYVARLGSFLFIPVQSDYVVSEVVGLRERDPNSNKGDSGEGSHLDKAGSAKFLDLVPVGMLPQKRDGRFRFGVSAFPSLYSDVLYALDEELDRIFEVDSAIEPIKGTQGLTRYKAISIGRSVVFQGYDVKVRVDEFFGGHVAVLGNTGSGKSCTVASILQSLFEKPDEYKARGATFVVFDVNGEYWDAFKDLPTKVGIGVHRLVLDGSAATGKMRLPHWFLVAEEWELLLRASERTQLPVLRMALGLAALVSAGGEQAKKVKQHFVAKCIVECFRGSDGASPVTQIRRVRSLLDKYHTDGLDQATLKQYGCDDQYGNFKPAENQAKFLEAVKQFINDEIKLPSYKTDTPFSFDFLEDALDFSILYEEAHGNRQIRDYCSQMLTRYKSLRDRDSYAFLRHGNEGESLAAFLARILGLMKQGTEYRKHNQIVIIDMNAVEDEVVELVVAVISRMIFDFLRIAEPRNKFPVNLVLEEAHRYVAERPAGHAVDASRVFERIAKEGRKYGLFLQVASQRPSEVSKTVLSQCSNFVVHRIQNPDDLSHIRQMTPFISDAVLRRLPSLPKQHALVFGNAVNLPTTFKVREAFPIPNSNDPRIREIWFHEEQKTIAISLPPDNTPQLGD